MLTAGLKHFGRNYVVHAFKISQILKFTNQKWIHTVCKGLFVNGGAYQKANLLPSSATNFPRLYCLEAQAEPLVSPKAQEAIHVTEKEADCVELNIPDHVREGNFYEMDVLEEKEYPRDVRILRQLEYYLSDLSYPRDEYLLERANQDLYGEVPLTILLSFPRLAAMNPTVEECMLILNRSKHLTCDPATGTVKRKVPILTYKGQNAYMVDFMHVFRNCSSLVELKEALEVFFQIKPVVQKVVACAIHRAGDFKSMKMASQITKALSMESVVPGFLVYNALALTSAKCGDFATAISVYELLVNKGYTVQEMNWAKLLQLAAHQKDSSNALKVLEAMKDKGFLPDVSTFNLLMKSCGVQDWQQAENMWQLMTNSGVTPDQHSYSVFFTASMGNPDYIKVLAGKLEEMKQKGISLSLENYKSYLKVLCMNGSLNESFQVFQEMESCGIAPDADCYSDLFAACRISNDSVRGENVIKMVLQSNIAYTPRLISSALYCCRVLNIGKPVFEFVDNALQNHFDIFDQSVITTLLGIAIRSRDHSLFDKYWNFFAERNLEIDAYGYGAKLLMEYEKSGSQGVDELVKTLQESNACSDFSVGYNRIIYAAVRKGDIKTALDFLARLDSSQPINFAAYLSRLSVCFFQMDTQNAKKLYLEMKQLFHSPESKKSSIVTTLPAFYMLTLNQYSLLDSSKRSKFFEFMKIVFDDAQKAGVSIEMFKIIPRKDSRDSSERTSRSSNHSQARKTGSSPKNAQEISSKPELEASPLIASSEEKESVL